MALKTPDNKPLPTAPSDTTMLLELALYSRYTRKKNTYIGGQVYRFKREDAMQLLTDTDAGRPIWRMWRKPAPKKQTATTTVMDATAISVERIGEPPSGLVPDEPGKRIDVGSDEEISDILNRPEPGPDDVTV
jgi:hypothetical protein